jgi:ABC-type nitrate/sulfonate/bicarbonate transport system permease component
MKTKHLAGGGAMDKSGRASYSAEVMRTRIKDKLNRETPYGKRYLNYLYMFSGAATVILFWQVAAMRVNHALLLPTPASAFLAFFQVIQEPKPLLELLITMKRVGTGFLIALGIGLPIGYLMGYSKTFLRIFDPLINTFRQIPIMAWVPLMIIWLGLGDAPTVFLITVAALFPVMLNTVASVQDISPDYYNAARSMGAGPLSIFTHVIVPGSLPGIMTGMRIGMGTGWMSVI